MPEANTYDFQGPQVTVGFGVGIGADEGFFYQDLHQTLRLPNNELQIVKTEIGLLVTATIRTAGEMLLGRTSFTLLIPAVELGDGFGPLPIQSLGIYTLHVPIIFARRPVQQQIDRYTEVQLVGTARHLLL